MHVKSILYRLYHRIPARQRLEFLRKINSAASRITAFRIIWTKVILRYHFLYGAPPGLTIELTDKCNLKCTYCPKSADIGVKGSHMDWNLFTRVIEGAMKERKVEVFNLVGFGEPLLYPRLDEAVRYIRRLNPTAKICLTSNGTLLTAETAKRLAEAGLTQITISVNATSAAQYERINASSRYADVVNNTIEFLRAINESNKNVVVVIQVLSGVNDDAQIQKFRDFWQPYLGRCGVIQVQPLVNWAGQIDKQGVLAKEGVPKKLVGHGDYKGPSAHLPMTWKWLWPRQRKNRVKQGLVQERGGEPAPPEMPEGYPCYHLERSRIISREGNALACCMVYPDDQGDLKLGNIREHSIAELYGRGKIVELRRANRNGDLGRYSPCNRCDAWKTVPNIWWRNPLHRWLGPRWL